MGIDNFLNNAKEIYNKNYKEIKQNISDNDANDYGQLEKMKKKIRTDEGRILYSRRMPTIEKIFGHMKKNLRFERFLVKGLKKVNIYWFMICTCYNMKRIYNLIKTG